MTSSGPLLPILLLKGPHNAKKTETHTVETETNTKSSALLQFMVPGHSGLPRPPKPSLWGCCFILIFFHSVLLQILEQWV